MGSPARPKPYPESGYLATMLEVAPEARPHVKASQAARVSAEYAAIERVLLGSVRGRWFLAEYARRHRAADTETLLDAIMKLEMLILRPQRRHPDHLLADLVEMRDAIERTRGDVAAIKPPDQPAREGLDHIAAATEKATSEILDAAEKIQEVGWTLREKGLDTDLCDKLDQHVADLYMTCSFQDITGQRTKKVVKVLGFIEQRLNAMIETWGIEDIGFRTDPLEEPARAEGLVSDSPSDADGLKQDDIDAVLEDGAVRDEGRGKTPSMEAEAAVPAQISAPVKGDPQPASDLLSRQAVQDASGAPQTPPSEPLTVARLDSVKREVLFG